MRRRLYEIHSRARIKVGVAMVEPENILFSRLDGGTAHVTWEQQRLKALSELGLLEAETIPVFEEATQTAAHSLKTPICILGFLDQKRHWFKSAVGLSRIGLMNQLAKERQLPRGESFCTHVVENHQVLAIGDALSDENFANLLLVQRYGIRAYLGVPLWDAAGHCLGAIAVMDLQPRTFTIRDIEFLELIARWSMSEFERNRLLQEREIAGAVVAPQLFPAGNRRESLPSPRQHPGEFAPGWGDRGNDLTPTLLPITRKSYLEDEATFIGSPTESLTRQLDLKATPSSDDSSNLSPEQLSTIQVKLELLAQLTQELRTPLTSVLGMASVLGREIYGPLTSKQKEYLEIIQNSGRYLLSVVNEISELGTLVDSTQALNLTSVDIEMLCQQAINTLNEAANRREQQIRLSVEPGRSRIWVLDKDKVRHMLYHLVFSVIQAATTGSAIHIHVSHKGDGLNLAVSVSHPWLGNGLTLVDPYLCQLPVPVVSNYPEAAPYNIHPQPPEPPILPVQANHSSSGAQVLPARASSESLTPNSCNRSSESLRLLISCHLAELHGGQISFQGTPESGYRYVVSLPNLTPVKESL